MNEIQELLVKRLNVLSDSELFELRNICHDELKRRKSTSFNITRFQIGDRVYLYNENNYLYNVGGVIKKIKITKAIVEFENGDVLDVKLDDLRKVEIDG